MNGEFRRTGTGKDHFVGGRVRILRTRIAFDTRFGADTAADHWIAQTALRFVDQHGRTISSATATRSIRFRTWRKWTGHGWTIVQWTPVYVGKPY